MTMLDDRRTPATPERQPTLGRAHLEAELDALGDTYLPPATLRASILGRVQAQATAPRSIGSPGRQPHPIVRPRRGLLVVAAALATAALLGSAAATGIISLPDRALDPYPDWYQTGIGQIVEQHLGVHLNLSQRICGFTMTINRAYADRHIAVVAYTLRGPAGRRWGETGFFADASLRDAQGHTFPFAGGRSTAPPYILGDGNYTAFELSRAPGPPRTLALRLTVASIQGGEVLDAGRKAGVTCEVYGKTFPRGTGSKQAGPTRLVRAWGPRTFAFALPADARMRTLAPRKRVLAGGTAITLTRVEVTPIDVRMYLHGAKGGDFYGQLSIGNRHGRKTTASEGYSTRRNAVLSADAPLYGYHGPATLTISANRWASGRPTLPGGPWTFHFIIP